MAVPKIVLDTNLFISILLRSPALLPLHKLIREGKIRLIMSPAQIAELTEVLHRPKFGFDKIEMTELLDWLHAEALFVTPEPLDKPVSRDPKDDFLLAAAVSGEADALLSGDRDLLILESFGGIPILSVSDFFRFFKS